jgi:histidine triad (HIT) family protein
MPSKKVATMDCIFCKIAAGEIPGVKVYEDQETLAFMDINPRSDGHCLIIPKKHYPTIFDIPEKDLLQVIRTSKTVAMAIREALRPEGMVIYQLNGKVARQLVDHFHVHLVPQWEKTGADLKHGREPGDQERIKAVAAQIAAAIKMIRPD